MGGVVVRETGRDALSEAFRILRSNMTFMNVSSGKEIKCVLFTSSDPHAGKTFVAMNLAMTLAMAGKRVVLIDLDLRRHALTTHLGRSNSKNGMSGYLAGTITDIDQLVTNMGFHENLDVICAGIQPPNPTEMLLSNRLDKLVEQLKERYDFVFIDSTPAMSVADAVITDRLADLCIYIVREGVLDRRQLPDIDGSTARRSSITCASCSTAHAHAAMATGTDTAMVTGMDTVTDTAMATTIRR